MCPLRSPSGEPGNDLQTAEILSGGGSVSAGYGQEMRRLHQKERKNMRRISGKMKQMLSVLLAAVMIVTAVPQTAALAYASEAQGVLDESGGAAENMEAGSEGDEAGGGVQRRYRKGDRPGRDGCFGRRRFGAEWFSGRKYVRGITELGWRRF